VRSVYYSHVQKYILTEKIQNFGLSSVIEVALACKKMWKSSGHGCIKVALMIDDLP
jgi:hypothetical protein